jgi:predicted glycosyltransferase involved in capsule biosynthesis
VSSGEVSVIVPVRCTDPASYLERLRLRDGCDQTGVSTIIVDDGSPMEVATAFRAFCAQRGWQYVPVNSGSEPFLLARARNAGIEHAKTEWLLFDDADMVYGSTFFQDLRKELTLLERTPFNFLSLPAVYLTESASREVFTHGGIDSLRPYLLTRLMLEDPRGSTRNVAIEHFAPASAILALPRQMAVSIGGYDTGFQGWGGEDRDFIFRLLCTNRRLPRPDDFTATKVWNLNDTHRFEGWRSLLRLHGDYMARKGMYSFHLHHAPRPWRTKEGSEANMCRAAGRATHVLSAVEVGLDAEPELRRSLLFSAFELQQRGRVSERSQKPLRERLAAKTAKLYRDPHTFFEDAASPSLRMLRHLFKKKENVA